MHMMVGSRAENEDADNATNVSVCGVDGVPAEILLRIFELVLSADLDLHGFAVPARTTAPLLLTWVCSPWRRLAISYSKLWTSVSIGSRGSTPSSDGNILDAFISRSGTTLPLSFALNYDQCESSRPYELSISQSQSISYLNEIRDIAKRLILVRHRWRRLAAHVPILDALGPFLQALSQGTSMLEYLSVSTMHTRFHGPQFTLDLKPCSRLRTVRILTPMVFFDPSLPLLEHLTTLHLQFCRSQPDAYSWLSCCPNLEKLSIELYGSLLTDQIDPSMSQKIRLPRLTHFSLMCFFGESIPGPLFDTLILPALHSFSFARCGLALLRPDRSWQNVIGLLERSGFPSVQELRLIDTPTNASELSAMLQRVGSSVRYLALGGDAVTDELLWQFCNRPAAVLDHNHLIEDEASLLCPKLESLDLLNVDASFSSIMALALSRVVDPNEKANNLLTLRRLGLSSDKFSERVQHSETLSQFPRGLNVVLL